MMLADVVLVGGQRLPANRGVLAALSECFRGLLLGMPMGRSEGGVQEIKLGAVSAERFRVELQYPYVHALFVHRIIVSGRGAAGIMIVRSN
jgi:hypothetical protein